MWGTKDQFYSSMKWHEIDPGSVQLKQFESGWGSNSKLVEKPVANFLCDQASYLNGKSPLKIRDTINVYQNNVCSYCRNRVLKRLNQDTRLEA